MFAAIGAFFKGLVDTPVKAAATTYGVIAVAHVPGNVKEAKAKGKGAMYVIGHSLTLGLAKPYMNGKSTQPMQPTQPAQPAPSAPTPAPATQEPLLNIDPKPVSQEQPAPVNVPQ